MIVTALWQLRIMCRLLIVVALCVSAAVYGGTPDKHQWNPDKWFEQNDKSENTDQGCTELQAELDVSQVEVRELRNKNKELEQSLAELQQKITNDKVCADLVKNLESRIRKLTHKTAKTQERKFIFERLSNETFNKLTIKVAENKDLLEKQVKIEAEKSDLLTKLTVLDEYNTNLLKSKDSLVFKNEKCETDRAALLTKEANHELWKLHQTRKLRGFETEINNLLKNVDILSSERDSLRTKEEKCQSEKSVVSVENSDLLKKLDILSSQRDSLRTKEEKCQSEKYVVSVENSDLLKKIDIISSQRDSLRTKEEKCQSEKSVVTTENSDLLKKVDVLSSQRDSLWTKEEKCQSEKSVITAENSDLLKKLDILSSQRDSLRTKEEKCQSEKYVVTTENSDLLRNVDRLSGERDNLRTQYEKCESEKSFSSAEKPVLLRNVDILTSERDSLRTKEEKCQSEKSVITTENSDLMSQFDRCRGEHMCMGKIKSSERCLNQLHQQQIRKMAQLAVESFATQNNLTHHGEIMRLACVTGNVTVTRARLDMGHSTEVTKDRSTPGCLHLATENNHVSLARMLLDRGANINTVSPLGETPLIAAVRNGKLESVQLLLDWGADLTLRDRSNLTALGCARKFKQQHLISYLSSKNAPE